MKKFKIDYRIKRLLVIIVAGLMVVIGYRMIHEIIDKEYTTKEIMKLKFDDESSLDYKIFLKDGNMLYDQDVIEEGFVLSNYIDHIQVYFKYKFDTNTQMNITNEGKICVVLEGFKEQNEQHIEMFKKMFDSVELNEKVTKNQIIEKQININISEYEQFIKVLFEETNFMCNTQLLIYADTNVSGKNEYKNINFKEKPILSIPLNSKVLEIKDNGLVKNSDTYNDTVSTLIPMNKKKVVVMALALFMLFVLMIILIIKTIAINRLDRKKKYIRKVFKEQGTYLVEIKNNINFNDREVINVKNIKDLVKISDEIRKPIFYKCEKCEDEVYKFYILTQQAIYICNLEESFSINNA